MRSVDGALRDSLITFELHAHSSPTILDSIKCQITEKNKKVTPLPSMHSHAASLQSTAGLASTLLTARIELCPYTSILNPCAYHDPGTYLAPCNEAPIDRSPERSQYSLLAPPSHGRTLINIRPIQAKQIQVSSGCHEQSVTKFQWLWVAREAFIHGN